jgi:hypothetical protein
MASHYRDNIIHGSDHSSTHASDSRWRHQESSSYNRHFAPEARDDDARGGSNDLVDFFNQSRVSPSELGATGTSGGHQPIVTLGFGEDVHLSGELAASDDMDFVNPAFALGAGGQELRKFEGDGTQVRVGPLLNYRRMEEGVWFGSVLVVTDSGAAEGNVPVLKLRQVGHNGAAAEAVNERADDSSEQINGGTHGDTVDGAEPSVLSGEDENQVGTQKALNGAEQKSQPSTADGTEVEGTKLYADEHNAFWRFDLKVPMQDSEIQLEYSIPGLQFSKGNANGTNSFFVPSVHESMRIMFHSCNGFSVGTDEEAFNGPCLWNDVNRVHKARPFHVM